MDTKRETEQARAIYKTIKHALDEDGFYYDADDEDLSLSFVSQGTYLDVNVDVRSDDRGLIIVKSRLPFAVPKEKNTEIAKAVNMASGSMIFGCFEFNFLKGSIFFRATTSVRGSLISPELIKEMIYLTFNAVEAYSDNLFLVAKDKMTLEEFEKAMEED